MTDASAESASVAGVVLAAGEGRRFGGPKAPYVHEGERLVDRSVRLLREAGELFHARHHLPVAAVKATAQIVVRDLRALRERIVKRNE